MNDHIRICSLAIDKIYDDFAEERISWSKAESDLLAHYKIFEDLMDRQTQLMENDSILNVPAECAVCHTRYAVTPVDTGTLWCLQCGTVYLRAIGSALIPLDRQQDTPGDHILESDKQAH